MNRLRAILLQVTTQRLLALASIAAVLGLAVMLLMTFVPIPLLTVLGMGAAHAFGLVGVLLFGLSVLLDGLRSAARRSAAPPLPPADQSDGK